MDRRVECDGVMKTRRDEGMKALGWGMEEGVS